MNINNVVKNVSDRESDFITDDAQIALEWCAVLASQNIDFELQKDGEFWIFFVESANLANADFNISEFENERPSFSKRLKELNSSIPEIAKFKFSESLLYIFSTFILFLFYNVSTNIEKYRDFGIMNPHKVIHLHQWERLITALTLHADYPHLLGNSLFFILFATVAGNRVGGGCAIFSIILSGILGNTTTLLLNDIHGYNSLGSSTAVFGALGIISAFSFVYRKNSNNSFFRNLIPLLAGIALLVFTGAAPGSDVTAHLFGFSWGVVLGFIVSPLEKFKSSILTQLLFYLLSIATILLAWISALNN